MNANNVLPFPPPEQPVQPQARNLIAFIRLFKTLEREDQEMLVEDIMPMLMQPPAR